MNKDNRVSNLPEVKLLLSDQALDPFPERAVISESGNIDSEALFLMTRSGSHNEKITYKNLKRSVLDNTVYLTGNQLISGEKTFADICTFQSTVFINEIIDITQTGDISGNIFVGESGLFDRMGIGLYFTDRRAIKDIFAAYPNESGDFSSLNYGGGIDPASYLSAVDFSGQFDPDLTTTTESFPIYEPSGYYNSTIPLSQQNWGTDISLDGHSLSPDDIHREMGGAWLQIDFDKPFNYKGFSIYRDDIEHSAEKIKVVGSNNGIDWNTLHRETGLNSSNYQEKGSPSLFSIEHYHTQPYSKYRLVSEKIISGNHWKIDNFSFSGVEFFDHVHTVDPKYTLHVSGNSCFIGDITQTGNSRHQGDLLRIGNTSLSGGYFITGDSFFTGNKSSIGDEFQTGNVWQIGDGFRQGDSDISGDINQTGDIYSYGFSWRSGDVDILGDVRLTGNLSREGESRQTGDFYHIGDRTQTGDCFIDGSETVKEDIYLGQYLYHLNDNDTFLKFTQDKVELSAGAETKIEIDEDGGDLIKFFTSGQEQMRLNKSGFLGINTEEPIGELSVTGDSYLECVFTTGEDGKWERVFGGSDEVTSFVTPLDAGQNSYKIDFPKTFGENPAISISLENNEGAPIVPYMISGTTNYDFYLSFGATLVSDGYRVHTSARATGQSEVNKTRTQSFMTTISPGSQSYEIPFPDSFHSIPNISATIETDSIIVSHLISGISKDSYHIIFGSDVKSEYKIHTHAVR